jgi:Na+/H+ antiporter NhaD/arsenite permease-like protein
MAALVARVALYLVFGFFIYETINELNKLFKLSLNPYFAIIPAAVIYVFQEFVIKKWKSNVDEFQVEKPGEAGIDKILFFVTWLLVAALFIGMFAIWAGVIYKQVIKGSEGSAIFDPHPINKNRASNSGSSR